MRDKPRYLRRKTPRRWLQEHVTWPLLEARDGVVRRHRRKALYGSVPLGARMRAKALDALPQRTRAPAFHPPVLVRPRHHGRAAFLALLLAAAASAAAIVTGWADGVTGWQDGQSASSASAVANGPAARVHVKGVEASSTGARARRRERALERRRAAARRERAAERRRARSASERSAAVTPPAPAKPATTPDSTPAPKPARTPTVSTPSQPPAPQPSAPARPPSRAPSSSGGGGSGTSKPPEGTNFDDSG
jgi:hypothetical protein